MNDSFKDESAFLNESLVWFRQIHFNRPFSPPTDQCMWAELSGENFRSPLTWVFTPTAQSRTRPLRSPLAYNFIPLRWNRSTLAHLKFLCMPNTCRFQPKPYAWDTLSAWQTWSGFVAWLLRKKSASLLFCRGVAVWLDHAPDTRIFRRQCGCSNLLT